MLAVVGGGYALSGRSTSAHRAAQQPRETKDRLSAGQMADMVEGPVALLRQGREAEADAAARVLVAAAESRGDKVRAADLLTAYAVQRFSHGEAGAPGDTRAAALPWLREAVTATRRAWGSEHPETAVALHDLAAVLLEISPDAPGAEAEQALREALTIRTRALGPQNVETIGTAKALADVLAAAAPEAVPAPPQAQEAETLYRRAAAGFAAHGPAIRAEERLGPWMGLAILEARQGQSSAALADRERAIRAILLRDSGGPDFGGCAAFVSLTERLEAVLKAHGERDAAGRLGARTGGDRVVACFDGRP